MKYVNKVQLIFLKSLFSPTNVTTSFSKSGIRCCSDRFFTNDNFIQQNYNVPRIKKTTKDDLSNFNLATHILRPWVEKQPDKLALLITDGEIRKEYSYLDLYEESRNLSSALLSGPFPAPTCCLVILPKIKPWWIINLAGSWCEIAISPGAPMITKNDIKFRMKSAEVDALFVNTTVMESIDEDTKHVQWRVLVEETLDEELKNLREGWFSYHQLIKDGANIEFVEKNYSGDAVAQLFFTSGTTGYPKLVRHTQLSYGLGHVPTARDWLNLGSNDLVWNLADLGWAKAAFSSLYAPLIAGSAIFIHQMPKFDSKTVLKTLECEPITTMCLPPTALRSLLQENLSSFKPKSLKIVTSAGEPLNPEVIHIWNKFTGILIREGYGQSEGTLMCGVGNDVKVKPGTLGKPFADYDIKILSDNFEELETNEVGQIGISLKNGWPTGLFKGYAEKEQNDQAFVSDYYLTGDRAFIDEEGYICYVGRSDDIIISAGYTIGPYEVESALIEHPAVIESAVVASPDYDRGHVVKAFIVLSTEYAEKVKNPKEQSALIKELQDFVKKTVAPYKYPRKIEFVGLLSKTVSGKIRRVELRDKEKLQNETKLL